MFNFQLSDQLLSCAIVRRLLCAIAVLVTVAMAPAHAALNGTVANPNILIYIADDMGWGDSRAYNSDAQFAMPNLEKLANEGMRFNDAHTSGAKCAPARYAIMSGNYQYRGLQKWGQWNYRGGTQFLDGQRTLGDIAKDAGYATAYIGKMHLGGEFYEKNTNRFVNYQVPETDIDFARGMFKGPVTYGFDYDYVILRGIQRSPYAFFENDRLVGRADDLSVLRTGTGLGSSGLGEIIADGIGMPDWDSSQVGPLLAEKALDFIDQHHQTNLNNGTDTPFFMFYSPEAAHGPFTPPLTFLGEAVRGVTGISTHTDMLYENDVALGKLLEALRVRGLEDDTLIIFTSDNGGVTAGVDKAQGHFSVANLAGRKGEILEGGHRVPFIAKWGNGTSAGSIIPPGTVTNQLVGSQDLMATLAAMWDQTLPSNQARDSFNILPVLLGQQSESTPIRDHLMMEADTVNGIAGQPRHWAYREGPWKLIFDTNDNPDRLFNLNTDLSERNNLLNNANQAARVQSMTANYLARKQAQRTAPVAGPSNSIAVDAKIAGVDAVDAPGVQLTTGSSVNYTYDVVNNGNATLSDIRVFSRQRQPTETDWGLVCERNSLDAGARFTCTEQRTAITGLVRRDVTVQAQGSTYVDTDRTFYTGVATATPVVSIGSTTINENGGTAVIDVTLNVAASQPVTVSVAANNGTAVLGGDFNFTPTTVTIAANQTSTTTSVAIVDDATAERQETFSVSLSNPVNATLGTAQGTVTIIDNDSVRAATVSVGNVTVAENDGRALIPVTLSRASTADVTGTIVTIAGGSAAPGLDYYAIAPTLFRIAAGTLRTTVPVTILDDLQVESTETIRVVLHSPLNAQLGTTQSQISITDNDVNAPVTASITDQTVSEDVGVGRVAIRLNRPTSRNVTITAITSSGGSATEGVDYYGVAPTTVTIPAGSTTGTYDVGVLDDPNTESNETVVLRILEVNGAAQGVSTALLTIVDNDGSSNCGAPSIDRSSRDLHLWRDCGTNQWHLVSTAGSETSPRVYTTYEGKLTSTAPFSGVSDPSSTDGLEMSDRVDNSVGTVIDFALRMESGNESTDPLDFTTANNATTCLNLTDGATPRRVLVGPNKTAITGFPFNIVTYARCN